MNTEKLTVDHIPVCKPAVFFIPICKKEGHIKWQNRKNLNGSEPKKPTETQLAREQRKPGRPQNREKYPEKGERRERTHHLCNSGGTIESIAPEAKEGK